MSDSVGNITGTSAPIYTADLLYEQQCKCGATEVFETGDEFNWVTKANKGWKLVAMDTSNTIEGLTMTNVLAADTLKLVGVTYSAGQEICGLIEAFNVGSGVWILYKDCNES